MVIPTREETELVERVGRVSLKPDGATTGYVDGAWWPGSRDLSTELPSLLAMLATRLGRAEQVTYNLTVWGPAPRRLVLDGRGVRLSGFRSQRADTVTVIGRGGQQRLTLLVVPPHTDPTTAAGVLTRAAQPDGVDTIEALLTPARIADTDARIGEPTGVTSALQRWEGEGGRGGDPDRHRADSHTQVLGR